jgi:hypothetical protein
MEAAFRLSLGRDIQAALEFSRFDESTLSRASVVVIADGVVGSCDHALTLTSTHGHNQSRVPSLD